MIGADDAAEMPAESEGCTNGDGSGGNAPAVVVACNGGEGTLTPYGSYGGSYLADCAAFAFF